MKLLTEILSEEEIKEKIRNPETEAVSFGVADCLVKYPFWEYSDMFRILQNDFCAVSGNGNVQFASVRKKAEQYIRRHSRTGSADMRRIYRYISETQHITVKEAETIINIKF